MTRVMHIKQFALPYISDCSAVRLISFKNVKQDNQQATENHLKDSRNEVVIGGDDLNAQRHLKAMKEWIAVLYFASSMQEPLTVVFVVTQTKAEHVTTLEMQVRWI